MNKIKSSDLKLGMCFSSPVFFEDGTNMFLAEKNPITQNHLSALELWKIPYVITYGTLIQQSKTPEPEEIKELEPIQDEKPSLENLFENNTLNYMLIIFLRHF